MLQYLELLIISVLVQLIGIYKINNAIYKIDDNARKGVKQGLVTVSLGIIIQIVIIVFVVVLSYFFRSVTS